MKRENGFTLTELLVAMVIAGVVMAAVYSAYVSQQKAYKITEEVSAIQQNLRAAMFFLERDIRMAGYDPTGTDLFGFQNISSPNQETIQVTWDEDEDGLSGATEYVLYKVEDNALKQDGGDGNDDIIAEAITGVTFAFLTGTGTPTFVASNIRMVDITLTGQKGGHQRSLTSRIYCRNMGM